MGDPFDTWTPHDHNNQPPLWLRDFLPKTIPSARILTFGYDADLTTRTVLNIMGFAENLLAGLKANRGTGVRF
jgi:hypothetical protein